MPRIWWRRSLRERSTITERKLGSPPNPFYPPIDESSKGTFSCLGILGAKKRISADCNDCYVGPRNSARLQCLTRLVRCSATPPTESVDQNNTHATSWSCSRLNPLTRFALSYAKPLGWVARLVCNINSRHRPGCLSGSRGYSIGPPQEDE